MPVPVLHRRSTIAFGLGPWAMLASNWGGRKRKTGIRNQDIRSGAGLFSVNSRDLILTTTKDVRDPLQGSLVTSSLPEEYTFLSIRDLALAC